MSGARRYRLKMALDGVRRLALLSEDDKQACIRAMGERPQSAAQGFIRQEHTMTTSMVRETQLEEMIRHEDMQLTDTIPDQAEAQFAAPIAVQREARLGVNVVA